MCGHAGTVGALRPLRRLPAPAGRPGAGGRPGPPARPARHRPARGAHRGVPDGAAGLAAPPAAGRRRRLSAHAEGRPAGSTRPPPGSTAPTRAGWDGRFDLSSCTRPPARRDAQRLAATWPTSGTACSTSAPGSRPGPATRSTPLLAEAGVGYERFTRHARGRHGRRRGTGPPRLGPRRRSAARTRRFVAEQRPACWPGRPPRSDDEQAYAARFRLVHAWRTFLFRDPQLPAGPAAASAGPAPARRRVLRPARDAAAPGRRPLRGPLPRRRGLRAARSKGLPDDRELTCCSSTAPTASSR